MSTTLTHVPTGNVQAITKVLGYTSSSDADTVVHKIIGVGNPEFTMVPTRPRTGTFDFLCMNETQALTLRRFLSRLGSFYLEDTEVAMANTTFMVTGSIRFALDDETRQRIVVSCDYTEVTVT